ncbi:MAG: hypothetical protein ACR2LJ_12940 [Acidimicrobiales bacterium]
MHPIERLRMVARAEGEDPGLVAREAAGVLAASAGDPASLVTGCRRLVDHQPTSGPIWWLAARVLAAADPAAEAWRAADELAGDATPAALAYHLPVDQRVVVVGWPDQAAAALARRGDCDVLVVDAIGTGGGLAAYLRRAGTDAIVVDQSGLGAAVVASDLVVLEATAVGPDGFVGAAGSLAAAAVARQAGVGVWVVAGAGRILPLALWKAMCSRLETGPDPWDRGVDVVALDLVGEMVGPDGPQSPVEAAGRPGCPTVPELTRTWAAPGTRRPGSRYDDDG